MFGDLTFDRDEAVLDKAPADVNVRCIQPVMIDRYGVFLNVNN